MLVSEFGSGECVMQVGDRVAIERAFLEKKRKLAVCLEHASGKYAEQMAPWAGRFMVVVKTGRERPVFEAMTAAGIEAWVPRVLAERGKPNARGGRPPKEKDLVRVLAWPGFVVVNMVASAYAWHGLMSFDDVIAVAGGDGGGMGGDFSSWAFEPPKDLLRFALKESTVVAMMRMELSCTFDFSTRERLFKAGDTVRVKNGLLAGYQGVIHSKRAGWGFAWVSVEAYGRTTTSYLPVDDLEEIH